MQSLYCDLGATPCWWSSVLLKLCGEMLQVYDMNNGTITGNGIVQESSFLSHISQRYVFRKSELLGKPKDMYSGNSVNKC